MGLHVRSLFLGPSVDDIGTSVLITSPPEVVGRLTLVLDIRRAVRLATAADLGKVCVCAGSECCLPWGWEGANPQLSDPFPFPTLSCTLGYPVPL
jgi:hypothetical protein